MQRPRQRIGHLFRVGAISILSALARKPQLWWHLLVLPPAWKDPPVAHLNPTRRPSTCKYLGSRQQNSHGTGPLAETFNLGDRHHSGITERKFSAIARLLPTLTTAWYLHAGHHNVPCNGQYIVPPPRRPVSSQALCAAAIATVAAAVAATATANTIAWKAHRAVARPTYTEPPPPQGPPA